MKNDKTPAATGARRSDSPEYIITIPFPEQLLEPRSENPTTGIVRRLLLSLRHWRSKNADKKVAGSKNSNVILLDEEKWRRDE